MEPLVPEELNDYNISDMAYKACKVFYLHLHRKSLLDSILEPGFYSISKLEILF